MVQTWPEAPGFDSQATSAVVSSGVSQPARLEAESAARRSALAAGVLMG
jgi:hypothetical protein